MRMRHYAPVTDTFYYDVLHVALWRTYGVINVCSPFLTLIVILPGKTLSDASKRRRCLSVNALQFFKDPKHGTGID